MPEAPLTAERGPFTGGYTSSVPAFMARPDQLTADSQNVTIDPFTGGVSRRYGCAIINDTASASSGLETNGLLNHSFGAKCRKLFAIDSPSLADGYSTTAALYGEDTNAGFPTADAGFDATIWLNSTNTGAINNGLKNYSLLEEFSMGNTYGVPGTEPNAASYRLKVVPIWYESGDGVYNRGALTGTAGTDQFMQRFLACGSRSLVQTQDWLYAPNLRATPWRWNKRFNESGTVGTETIRVFPTGPFRPLWPPTVTTPASSTSETSWSDGDTFYLSVIFRFSDGSCSAPFIPRAPQANIFDGVGGRPNGLGLVKVGTIGGTSKYRYLTYSNIPVGWDGVVERILCRSVKQNRTASTDNITVSPLDLRVIGVLRNNTQKSYIDYGGDDSSLTEDDDVIRWDHTLPRRARFMGTGDQRAIIGYTLPNTAAIMLAPVGTNDLYDRNFADDNNNCYGSTGAYVRITSTQLELHYNPGAAPDFVAPGNARAFLFSTYDTVEKLVDAINGLTYPDGTSGTTDLARQWAAQLVPGIDPTMPTTSLTLTTMDIACSTTVSTTLTSAALFGPVGVGMKVSGTNITAGTYVVSKASASSLTLSTAATGVGSPTLTFYQETGDNTVVTGGTLGYMRAFSGTYPLLLHMKPSAFPDYATPDKTSVYFTVASPGAATSGISLAPNSWVAANRRLAHSSPRSLHARSCTGIVDIEGAALIAFSDGIHIFRNQRGANSGEDFDYRLFTVSDTRGCISYLGLCSGNGWAAYPTAEGIVITDKNGREFTISGDLFNPATLVGDLANEISKSAASVAADTDDQYFSMNVMGSQLVVAVRRSGASPALFRYDFSPGVEASGVEELLNPETKRAYVWTPKQLYNTRSSDDSTAVNLTAIGAMGSVRLAAGRRDYISFDSNNGSKNGRIDLLDQNLGDNGYVLFQSDVVPAPFAASPFMDLQPQRVEVTHKALAAAVGSSLVAFANNQTPTFQTAAPLVRTINRDSNKTQFQKQVMAIDNQQRVKTDQFWTMWRSTATTASAVVDVIWRIVLQYDEAEN